MSVLKKLLSISGDNTPESDGIEACSCAVCGCITDHGRKFTSLFSRSMFNLNHEVKVPDSNYVCSHCAVFFSRENWRMYCERNGMNPFFPTVKGKDPSLANWMFFSHYFAKDDHRIVRCRHDWRGYLLSPPDPPFCFVITTLAKKHLLFKAEIAYNRHNYPIRFEDKIVYINVDLFSRALSSFEMLYAAGLNKSSIRTGDYNSSMLLKIDRDMLLENEEIIKSYRIRMPDYLYICEFIAKK